MKLFLDYFLKHCHCFYFSSAFIRRFFFSSSEVVSLGLTSKRNNPNLGECVTRCHKSFKLGSLKIKLNRNIKRTQQKCKTPAKRKYVHFWSMPIWFRIQNAQNVLIPCCISSLATNDHKLFTEKGTWRLSNAQSQCYALCVGCKKGPKCSTWNYCFFTDFHRKIVIFCTKLS